MGKKIYFNKSREMEVGCIWEWIGKIETVALYVRICLKFLLKEKKNA